MSTKEEIIDAMIEIFSEKGYMASMSDISKAVGIKVPSIYSHFKSKDEIIALTVKKEIETFTQFLKENIDTHKEGSSEEILKDIYFSYIDYFKDNKKLTFWNHIDLIPSGALKEEASTGYGEYMMSFMKIIEDIFEKGVTQGEIKEDLNHEFYLLYITIIQGILRGMIKFKDFEELKTQYYNKIWHVFWESIKTK